MKQCIVAIFCLVCSWLTAGEYPYSRMATTGLQERIVAQNETETTIVCSKKLNPEARIVLWKILELDGIHGIEGKSMWNGTHYDQGIIIKGQAGANHPQNRFGTKHGNGGRLSGIYTQRRDDSLSSRSASAWKEI
jgi:hypothetical protein